MIGSQLVPFVPASGEIVLEFPWLPATTGPYGILARYTSPSDPMTFPETTSVLANATNNNNIAWKNVAVVALPPVVSNEWTSNDYPVLIVNTNPMPGPFDVEFGGDGPFGTAFVAQGALHVTLPPDLFLDWQLAGGTSTGLALEPGTTTFRMISPTARLSGLPLAPLVEHTLELRFSLPAASRIFRRAPAPLHLRQYAAGSATPVGGFTFEFTRPELRGIKR